MSWFAIVVLSVALATSAVALAREIQLRKALQRLLSVLLSQWRAHVRKSQTPDPSDPHDAGDDRL